MKNTKGANPNQPNSPQLENNDKFIKELSENMEKNYILHFQNPSSGEWCVAMPEKRFKTEREAAVREFIAYCSKELKEYDIPPYGKILTEYLNNSLKEFDQLVEEERGKNA